MTMPTKPVSAWRVRASLLIVYFVFAILLNSVGTVILQVINTLGVAKSSAAVLEAFKDLSIAATSFAVASFIPRLGFKRMLVAGLAVVAAACAAMAMTGTFLATELLFLCTGVAFALVKVSVFSTIGLITTGKRAHASLMSLAEGVFMTGVLSGYWLFGYFIARAAQDTAAWIAVYWVLTAICAAAALFVLSTPWPSAERPAHVDASALEEFVGMLRLMALPLVYVFVLSIFLYGLIEQGVGSWLPTFNNEVLHFSPALSVQATSVFAATLAFGRIAAGVVMRRVSWYPVLTSCVVSMAALVIVSLPLAADGPTAPVDDWLRAPPAALVFPLIGLFMAPIYPALNSVMLSALPRRQHAAMTGLIVVFSALGGTCGSLITGRVFGAFGGRIAFYMTLVPMAAILIVLELFRRSVTRGEDTSAEAVAPA